MRTILQMLSVTVKCVSYCNGCKELFSQHSAKKKEDQMSQTLLEGSDSDFKGLQGLSVQLVFGRNLSGGWVQLQPAFGVTFHLETAQQQ